VHNVVLVKGVQRRQVRHHAVRESTGVGVAGNVVSIAAGWGTFVWAASVHNGVQIVYLCPNVSAHC